MIGTSTKKAYNKTATCRHLVQFLVLNISWMGHEERPRKEYDYLCCSCLWCN